MKDWWKVVEEIVGVVGGSCVGELLPPHYHITLPHHTTQVSATFAASLVTSPAIGAYLGRLYSDNLVIALATAVAVFDVIFIVIFVPESLPEKCRPSSWGSNISWEKADPFGVRVDNIDNNNNYYLYKNSYNFMH